MPFSDLRPRLLTVLLFAILAVSVLPCLAAGQETTAKATDATPAANAGNATEWDIPPEVEALFPKDTVFDEKLWEIITKEPDKKYRAANRQFISSQTDGLYEVCKEVLKNFSLYNGTYYPGCSSLIVNGKYKNIDNFRMLQWEDVNPRLHVGIIRHIYINKQSSMSYPSYVSNEFVWMDYAPIIKRLLERNSGIVMQRVMIDIDGDGNMDELFRFAIYPHDTCSSVDGSTGLRWTYHLVSDSSFSRCFNESFLNANPFYYKNKLYFIDNHNVYEAFFVKEQVKYVCIKRHIC